MAEKIKVEINPLQYYSRYASSDSIRCDLVFYLNKNGEELHFWSESSNNSINELLSNIRDYFSGKLPIKTKLYYDIPWVYGENCYFPYSFYVKNSKTWTFRYKRNENAKRFDIEYDLNKDDLLSLERQLSEQFSKIDWNSLGKTELYTFAFSKKEFRWCYSAKDFCDSLNKLCDGSIIKKIFVSATNYAEPLIVQPNYVNYYVGSELIIQFDSLLVDLLIHAEGLFEWRFFKNGEYTIHAPISKCIENGDEEFCDIGNVYDTFTLDYTNSIIKQVTVDDTDSWEWDATGFDKSKVGDPVEVPRALHFHLENGNTLSIVGLMDDFTLKMSKP